MGRMLAGISTVVASHGRFELQGGLWCMTCFYLKDVSPALGPHEPRLVQEVSLLVCTVVPPEVMAEVQVPDLRARLVARKCKAELCRFSGSYTDPQQVENVPSPNVPCNILSLHSLYSPSTYIIRRQVQAEPSQPDAAPSPSPAPEGQLPPPPPPPPVGVVGVQQFPLAEAAAPETPAPAQSPEATALQVQLSAPAAPQPESQTAPMATPETPQTSIALTFPETALPMTPQTPQKAAPEAPAPQAPHQPTAAEVLAATLQSAPQPGSKEACQARFQAPKVKLKSCTRLQVL